MNLLSIAAAYGVLVAVAQWGWGKDLFGIIELLGRANWWLPRWLDRLLPHVGFEGAEEPDIDRELEELTAARR